MIKHATVAALLVGLASLTLTGCGRSNSSSAEAPQTQPPSPGDPSWCNRGGMEAAKDASCKRQADKDFNKFIGKGGGT